MKETDLFFFISNVKLKKHKLVRFSIVSTDKILNTIQLQIKLKTRKIVKKKNSVYFVLRKL